jgi:hypothetical protein
MTRQRETMHSRLPLRGAVTSLSLTLIVAMAFGGEAAAADGSNRGQASGLASTSPADPEKTARAAVPGSVSVSITSADDALDRAVARIRAHHPRKAIRALGTVRYQVSLANQAAKAQIGKPPTDPESDDPPGPPSVMAVLGLDHRVGTVVVGLFDGRTMDDLVYALRRTLTITHQRRDALLDAVIALPAEGALDDYVDGMSDTLGIYTQEVRQVTSALQTFRLTPSGRAGLTNALARVRVTKAKVDAAFGGGE